MVAFQNSVIYQSYVTETNVRKHKHWTNKFNYFLSYLSQEIRRSKGGVVYEHDAMCFQIIAEVQREFNRKSQQ